MLLVNFRNNRSFRKTLGLKIDCVLLSEGYLLEKGQKLYQQLYFVHCSHFSSILSYLSHWDVPEWTLFNLLGSLDI